MKRRKKLSYILLAAIVLVVLVPCLALLLSGCGAESDSTDTEPTNYIIHVLNYNGSAKHLYPEKIWLMNNGLKVWLSDDFILWISDGLYIVINGDHCPICEE